MSRLTAKIAGIGAAAALLFTVGAGSALANVTRYHKPNGTVVTINTPDVATAVGTQTHVNFTVSVSGPSAVKIANEKFLTSYGWGDSQWDGLSFAHYGCWGRSLSNGQSCTDVIAFSPSFVGSHSESYMLATGAGPMSGKFTATGRRIRVVLPTSPLPVLASAQ
ncbi:MAG TPA: hypothetical protein VE127_04480 [Solirubrobacteraceae bacterium]|jgi:hypothetical protein|nr:hypothetical protein [Solirubrobacteraceae bacterium]